MEPVIVSLRDRPELAEAAAEWFHQKWGIPLAAYRESIAALIGRGPVPAWYLCLDSGTIAGGLGVIENDFHPRRDLTPNLCAVCTEPACRRRGIAGRLPTASCADLAATGIPEAYLLSDHTGFYERHGWEYLCPVLGDGGEVPSRMYRHATAP